MVSGLSYLPDLDSSDQEYTHVVATVTAAGNTTIYTPTAGKRVKLRWVYAVTDLDAANTPLIKVFLGAEEKFRVYALSKQQLVVGPIDGAVIINLSETSSVAVTVLLEEG